MTSSARLSALADRYRIERELGQGGMATVYLAEDLKHRRQVALKVLKPELVEWTPDGNRLVVSGFASREVDWFAADATDQPSVLYSLPDSVRAYWASFTPDGRELLLGTNLGTEGAANISMVRLEGDSALKALVAGEGNEVAPRLSPNGQWLAYASDESGQHQVYVRPYPGPGPRVQLSDDGGTQPMWSRNGQRLFNGLATR